MRYKLGLAALAVLLTIAVSSSALSATLNVAVSADPDTFDLLAL